MRPIIDWLTAKWRQHQRRTDLEVLWPICKAESPDLDHARAAFALHAFNDPAWLSLGEGEVHRRITSLE